MNLVRSNTQRRASYVWTIVSLIAALPAFAIAVSPLALAGDDQFTGFRSPSGNIHCMFDAGFENVQPNIRCDILSIEGAVPPRPADCDLEWGRSFGIDTGGQSGQLICAGDTVMNDQYPVLGYGQVWQQSGFTCTSDEKGVSCFNALRHGFTLSRASRVVF